MMAIRRADDRGHTRLDWLDSRHSFSFGEYFDARHTGFGPLRVINEDRIAPGGGFPTHGHRDMEILTWVVSGALAHQDSTGGSSVIHAGEVQRMSAGTGIRHSEFNASDTEPVHLLQIWVLPAIRGIAPGYEQKRFPAERQGRLRLIAARDGRDGALTIHRDAAVYAATLAAGSTLAHPARPGARLWLQVVSGIVTVNDTMAGAGDGVAMEDEDAAILRVTETAQVLLFDML